MISWDNTLGNESAIKTWVKLDWVFCIHFCTLTTRDLEYFVMFSLLLGTHTRIFPSTFKDSPTSSFQVYAVLSITCTGTQFNQAISRDPGIQNRFGALTKQLPSLPGNVQLRLLPGGMKGCVGEALVHRPRDDPANGWVEGMNSVLISPKAVILG